MDQALNALFQFSEHPVVGDADHLAHGLGADGVAFLHG